MDSLRRIRVLLCKTSLDGHWRGLAVVAAALRDAGMEVIYGGILRPEQAVNIAIQEDVDVIGLSIGGGYGVIEQLMQKLSEKQLKPLMVAGGTIPPPDVPLLEKMGIHKVFSPGSKLNSIVDYIKENIQSR
jgi:methylmalonyl-CoA mutase C-terminal domain/subunit